MNRESENCGPVRDRTTLPRCVFDPTLRFFEIQYDLNVYSIVQNDVHL